MLMINKLREGLYVNVAHITMIEFVTGLVDGKPRKELPLDMVLVFNNGESVVHHVASELEGLKLVGIGPVSSLALPNQTNPLFPNK